jgi:hypothetical protein
VKNSAVSIAAIGESVVPRMTLSHEVLDFGHCFLQHDYVFDIAISNAAKLPVQFKIEPQDDISAALARFTADPPTGIVAAQGAAYPFDLRLPTPKYYIISGLLNTVVVGNLLLGANVNVHLWCLGESAMLEVHQISLVALSAQHIAA